MASPAGEAGGGVMRPLNDPKFTPDEGVKCLSDALENGNPDRGSSTFSVGAMKAQISLIALVPPQGGAREGATSNHTPAMASARPAIRRKDRLSSKKVAPITARKTMVEV